MNVRLLVLLPLLAGAFQQVSAQSILEVSADTTGNFNTTARWIVTSGIATTPGSTSQIAIVDPTYNANDAQIAMSSSGSAGSIVYGTASSDTTITRTIMFRGSGTSLKTLTIAGDVTKYDTGTLVFQNNSATGILGLSIGGNVTLNEGTLSFGNSSTDKQLSSLSIAGAVQINGGTMNVRLASDTTWGALTINSGTLNLNTGAVVSGNRKVSVAALSGTGGTITDASTGTGAVMTLAVTGSQATSYSGTISNGAGTSAVAVRQEGTGVQGLNGANTYTGGTTVASGKVIIGNTSGSGVGTGAVLVQANGTFGGTGIAKSSGITAQSDSVIAPGGDTTLTPGDTLGTLHLDGVNASGAVLTMESGATFQFELAAGNASDRIEFLNYTLGDLVLNNTVINFTGAQAGTYTLFTFYSGSDTSTVASSGLNSGLVLGTGLSGYEAELVYGINSISLVVTPEPQTYVLLGFGLAGVMWAYRRRTTHVI